MKKHSTLNDIFSASMNLQPDQKNEESFKRFTNIATHMSKTAIMLILSALIAPLLYMLLTDSEMTDFEYIPLLLLIVLYLRYRDLHKQTLKLLGTKKTNSEPEAGADLT